MALTDKLTAIGNAIREKNGTTELIPLADMPQAILDISSGEETEKIVEYIESTGEQWIDTGIIPKNHRVVAKFQYTKEENKTLFGFFNNASESYHLGWYGGHWRYSCGSGSLTNVENISLCTDLQEIDFNNYDGKFLINGIECGSTNGTTTAYKTMPIFCVDHPTGKMGFCSAKLYYFKIYDRETQTLVRDFIPAIDESGVICLYDNVTKAYFYNQGSGEFKAGIIEKCKDVIELETLIDESGVLESTEGTATEKVEQLIDYKTAWNIAAANNGLHSIFRNFKGETIPQLDYSKIKNMYYFARGSKISYINFYIDCKEAKEFKDAFCETPNLKTIVGINTSNATTVSGMFYSSAIEEIQEPLNLSSTTSGSNTIFAHGANRLREIRIVKETIKWSTLFTSAVLSAESIQSIIDGLATVTTAQTLTLHKDIVLTDEQKATINAKGWTLAQ